MMLKDDLQVCAEVMRKWASAIPDAEDPGSGDDEIPVRFLCPHSRVIMRNPVTLSNGNTYERSNIASFIEAGLKNSPRTGELLDCNNVVPNHVMREVILEWCQKHKKYLHHFQYSPSADVTVGHFFSLHRKLQSKHQKDQKEAAKELLEMTKMSSFTELYAEIPIAICYLSAPLTLSDINPEIDPQIQEDLIKVLNTISTNKAVKIVIAKSPEGIRVLMDALRSDNLETQRIALSTIFQISSTDLDKIFRRTLTDLEETITKRKESFVELATLLAEEMSALSKVDDEDEYAGLLLGVTANLSAIEEINKQMEGFECLYLLQVVRESLSDTHKEKALLIVTNVLRKGGLKWKEQMRNDEICFETFKKMAKSGNIKMEIMAKEILDWWISPLPSEVTEDLDK